MLDIDDLVLGPVMDTFARPITVDPVASQPGEAGYDARGVWMVLNPDLATLEGPYSGQTLSLGIRLADFDVPPVPQDKVTVDGVTYWIDDSDPDGYGGAKLALKLAD